MRSVYLPHPTMPRVASQAESTRDIFGSCVSSCCRSASAARRHSTRPWRLVERFEWHYTPKHGGLAESELGVLSSQRLDRRIAGKQSLIDEVAPWQQERNANHTKANWHFTTPTARVKRRHLYPSI